MLSLYLALGLIAAWGIFSFAPPPWDLISYAAQATLFGLIILAFYSVYSLPPRIIAAVAFAAVTLIALTATFDTYDIEREDGGLTYLVTRGRWSGRAIQGRAVLLDGLAASGDGPVSKEGKAHGPWVVQVGSKARYAWFWNGKRIEETAWDSMNRSSQ
jgi:hypothetical protein